LWLLEKHLGELYAGGYFSRPGVARTLQRCVLDLCAELKDEAVALVDVLAPSDHLLFSPLGRSDGEAYKHLYNAVISNPGTFARPSWWAEFMDKPQPGRLHHVVTGEATGEAE
ncbi:MAG: acyl-CoA dehydrogenase, partial [Sphingomonas sp.]